MSKEVYYFSHDSNARQDPKISAMRTDFGSEGYGWFWIIIEMLRESEFYKLPCKKYIWNALAMQMQCKSDASENFIKQCINEYELFVTDGDFFWSNSLISRMDKKSDVSKKRRDAANKRWSDANAMQKNANAMQTDAIKVKESKVKESKSSSFKKEPKQDCDKFKIIWPWESENFKRQWEIWIAYRKEKKLSAYKNIGLQAALKKLAELANGNETEAIKIIHESIANNWQGFFKLKNDQNGKSNGSYSAEKLHAAIYGK